MRRQDEIIAVYAGQPPLARKFLFAQTEDLSTTFDAEELLEVLQKHVGDEDPLVRSQALYSLWRFLPGFIRKRYVLSGQAQGAWTVYGGAPAMGRQTRRTVLRVLHAPEVRRAALFVTRPLAQALLRSAQTTTGWNRTRNILALAQFGIKQIQSSFAQALAGIPDLPTGLAYAELSHEGAAAPVLDAVARCGPDNPDLYLLLTNVPGKDTLSLIADSASRTNTVGRMNLALALRGQIGEGLGSDEITGVLSRLREGGELWVDAAGLYALESLQLGRTLPTIIDIYEKSTHPFVRMQAVKAAGGLSGTDAIEFCMAATRSDHPGVCGMALESLVRLMTPQDKLSAVAAPFLESAHLRARMNAILAVLSPDDVLDHASFQGLLLCNDQLARLEAAYCLGYLRSRRALDLLGALVQSDPSQVVQIQAVKSLSKYPAEDAVPLLLPLLDSDNSRLLVTAMRVITRYESQDELIVGGALLQALSDRRRPAILGLIYRALGRIISRNPFPAGKEALLAGFSQQEAAALAGVVEGWILAGAAEEPSALEQLKRLTVNSPDPRLRARAMLALWHSGDLTAPGSIARMVESGRDDEFNAAMESSLEIGLLATEVSQGLRFSTLSTELLKQVQSPDFTQFAEQELEPARDNVPRPLPREAEFELNRPIPALAPAPTEPEPEPEPEARSQPQAGPTDGAPPVEARQPTENDLWQSTMPPQASQRAGRKTGSLKAAQYRRFLAEQSSRVEAATALGPRLSHVAGYTFGDSDRGTTVGFGHRYKYQIIAAVILVVLTLYAVTEYLQTPDQQQSPEPVAPSSTPPPSPKASPGETPSPAASTRPVASPDSSPKAPEFVVTESPAITMPTATPPSGPVLLLTRRPAAPPRPAASARPATELGEPAESLPEKKKTALKAALKKAQELVQAKQSEAAAKLLDQVLARDSTYTKARLLRARVLLDLKRYADAVADSTRVQAEVPGLEGAAALHKKALADKAANVVEYEGRSSGYSESDRIWTIQGKTAFSLKEFRGPGGYTVFYVAALPGNRDEVEPFVTEADGEQIYFLRIVDLKGADGRIDLNLPAALSQQITQVPYLMALDPKGREILRGQPDYLEKELKKLRTNARNLKRGLAPEVDLVSTLPFSLSEDPIEGLATRGYTTVVMISSTGCPGCLQVKRWFEAIPRHRTKTRVVYADVGIDENGGINWAAPVIQKTAGLEGLPHFVVLDEEGRATARGEAAWKMIEPWMRGK